MNKIILIFFLLFANIFFAQTSLKINFEPKKDISQSDYHVYKNDSLIYTNCSIKNDYSTLSHLEKGRYLVKYNTIYGIDSLEVNLKENDRFKFITLETEKIDKLKLEITNSEIESLKENENITLKYNLDGSFVTKKNKITLTKLKDKYYKVVNGKRKRIKKSSIENLIRYEKVLRNLNIEENVDGTMTVVNCSEYISIEKDNITLFCKTIDCGDWSNSSEIQKWIK